MGLAGCGDGRFGGGGVGNVTWHGDAADLGRDFLRALFIDVEQRDLRARCRQYARGARAEPAAAARDDRGLPLNLHVLFPPVLSGPAFAGRMLERYNGAQ